MAKPRNTTDKFELAQKLAASGKLPLAKHTHVKNFKPNNLYKILEAFGYRWDRALREWRIPVQKEAEPAPAQVLAKTDSELGFSFQVRIIAHRQHIDKVLSDWRDCCEMFGWNLEEPSRYYPADNQNSEVRVYLRVFVPR